MNSMTAQTEASGGRKTLALTLAALAGCATLALASLAPAHAGVAQPEPGLWDATSSATLQDTKTGRKCFTQAQIDRFLHGQPNGHTKCNYTRQELGDGKINIAGYCRDKSGIGGNVSASGTYSRTSMHVVAHGNLLGVPVEARLDAHRVGECPAGMK
jgi:hypothetical protein